MQNTTHILDKSTETSVYYKLSLRQIRYCNFITVTRACEIKFLSKFQGTPEILWHYGDRSNFNIHVQQEVTLYLFYILTF